MPKLNRGKKEEHGNWDLRHSLGAHNFESTRDMLNTEVLACRSLKYQNDCFLLRVVFHQDIRSFSFETCCFSLLLSVTSFSLKPCRRKLSRVGENMFFYDSGHLQL